ncbi:hypothetical protein BYT27DRAFT_7236304 [Phlegmacium glaucopus]|nr:hypothetical protein BYT27DRAFT_7236304 [Phlegmacium glaucopus]
MHSSSPAYECPSTPLALRNPLTYKPLNPSPLARSPDRSKSSPVVAAQARRRSQYKALAPNTPAPTRIFSNPRRSSGRLFSDGNNLASPAGPDPQKVFLRDRFKARCFERAAKARAKAFKERRYSNQSSSDDCYMDYDEEEDDEDIMQDELFRRIMANATRKEHHSYRISYAQEVGSSFDPDLEDVATWEQELTVSDSASPPRASTSTTKQPRPEEELTPVDLDDEELEAYAEECAQRAALADFDDIPEAEIFSWSDFEEPDERTLHSEHQIKSAYDMDIA